MRVTVALVSAVAFVKALAMAQQHCFDPWGIGLCLPTSECTKSGGNYATGYCPHDPADVKCCTFGECHIPNPYGDPMLGARYTTAECAAEGGRSFPGLCPGPSNIQCCRE
ncbi:hypothetical protein BGX26_000574 [Mortierella sp. AD094]|nr:hypothetical protein BGX26_000574 [Mortierella sp. AD094]